MWEFFFEEIFRESLTNLREFLIQDGEPGVKEMLPNESALTVLLALTMA